MIALVTDSKVILYITLGIPVLLGLIALGAAMTRPKQ
jgi:hypothetical protein